MDYNLKLDLQLEVTGKDVEEFFLERPDCLRKLEVVFKLNRIYSFFKQSIYQEIKEQVRGTELENEDLFNSIYVMEECFMDNAKANVYNIVLQNLISKRTPMNTENVLKVIDEFFMVSLLKKYKETILFFIELFKEVQEEEKENLRKKINEPSQLLN